jgi:hypothetical protein
LWWLSEPAGSIEGSIKDTRRRLRGAHEKRTRTRVSMGWTANPLSLIADPESLIPNQESCIPNPAIRDAGSTIRDSGSAIKDQRSAWS